MCIRDRCSIPGNRIITDESTSIASHPKLPRVIFTNLEDVEIPIQVPLLWREKNLFHLIRFSIEVIKSFAVGSKPNSSLVIFNSAPKKVIAFCMFKFYRVILPGIGARIEHSGATRLTSPYIAFAVLE